LKRAAARGYPAWVDSDLYDRDILAWSAAQADRLRRLSAGERVNDLDWPHIIAEIADLGISELRAVLRLALLHAVKIAAYPDHPARAHWTQELLNVMAQARDGFQPSMAQRLDVAPLHADALRDARLNPIDAQPIPVAERIELDIAALMDPRFTRDDLIRAVSA